MNFSISFKREKDHPNRTIAETTVITIALTLDPTGTAPTLLKLCFQLLKVLRHHHRK